MSPFNIPIGVQRTLTAKGARKEVAAAKPREPYDPRKHGISQTNLATWLECREKARLRYVEGLTPEFTKTAFMQGNHYHDLLEVSYKRMRDGSQLKPVLAGVKLSLGEKEKALTKLGAQTRLDEQMQTLDFASVLIPAYFEHWKVDFSRKWTHVEEKFSIPIYLGNETGVTINFQGKYDQGFMKPNAFWLMETKFKSKWNDTISDFLQLDLQTCSYAAAAKAQGLPLKGCVYNIIRKPQLKRKQTESRKEFLDRVKSDIADRPKFYFERHAIEFGKAELEAGMRRLTALITSYYEWWKGPHKGMDLLFNSGACENKYGSCEYLPLCARGDRASFKKYGDLR